MKQYSYEDMDREFKLGILAGITLVLGIAAVAVCCYVMYNPQILG